MKLGVNLRRNAAGAAPARLIAFAFWAWLIVSLLVAALAWRFGAEGARAAEAAALAIAPAFLGFILLPRLGESMTRAILVAAWLAAAIGLCAGSGGAYSPLAAAFAIPPALAAALGLRMPATVGAAAVLGYAAAALLWLAAPPLALGPWAPMMAAASLVFAGGLLALRADPGAGGRLPETASLARVDVRGRVLALTPEAARRLGVALEEEDLFAALWEQLTAEEQRALEAAVAQAAGGENARVVLRLGARSVEIEAAPAAGAALLDVRDVSHWTLRASLTSERVAEVSHELRTPLTHILGFAEMMQTQIFGPLSDRYLEYAGLIRTSGANLLDLINRLLDLSKVEAGRYELEYEQFDAREIVREVLRVSQGAAEPKRIALSEDLPDEPLKVRADPRALRQMLINTVGNAVKFTPEGGHVAVQARAEDGKLVLDTIDDGPGIPVEERARLGRRYARGAGAKNTQGTGLGLALVRAFAELHGGALSFHDAPGGGALVRIEMPVMNGAS